MLNDGIVSIIVTDITKKGKLYAVEVSYQCYRSRLCIVCYMLNKVKRYIRTR